MTMTIVEFLEARIAEDEQIATAAVDAEWHHEEGEVPGVWTLGDRGALFIGESPRQGCAIIEAFEDVDEEFKRHMDHYDPARALAEVAAKRAIIAASNSYGGPPWEDADIDSGEADAWDGRQTAYREVLANLAAVYSSHPDYQQEWAL